MAPVRRLLIPSSLCFGLLLASSSVKADRIMVRNGSLIKGKAIVDAVHPDQYLVIGEKGKTPIILKKDRVLKIEPEPSILDDYLSRREAILGSNSTSAQDEYNLAVWCRDHKLFDLATVHLESSLKRDPEFGPAHQKLGHVLHDGRWMTASELKTAQGYILYKGKWLTPEEKDKRDVEASVTAEQESWSRRLAILKQAIINGPEVRSRAAEAQLLEIREVAAIRSVVRTFGTSEDPALRKLAARVLGSIPGPESSSALVARLLSEPDAEVREATLVELARSREANIGVRLAQGLKSESLAVINRAAWALGNLNAVDSVPKLIPVLVSTELRTVWVPTNSSGQGNGFGSVMPSAGSQQGFGISGRSIPVLTGPVVGPGVVAFGATSVPASTFGTSGFNIGGADRGSVPKFVSVSHQNVEVLSSLIKMTGKDFGYDIPAWQQWLRTAYQPNPLPAKRVPQP